MVTGEQVRAAVMAAGIAYIPHHQCGCCEAWVGYEVYGGDLYFSPDCGCGYSPSESMPWSDAAEWINMHTNDDARAQIMAKFGMVGSEVKEKTE